MRLTGVMLLTLLTVMACACGSSNSKSINGPWFAKLVNPDGTSAFMFATTLAQGSDSVVSISSFDFMSPSPCFSSPTSQNATFSITGSSHGYQTGPFRMGISTVFPQVNNVLTLSGNRNSDGTISGTWTGTGLPGCDGNGSFTMTLPPPV